MNLKIGAGVLTVVALVLFICGPSRAAEAGLVWSTFLGGSENEGGNGIAVDDSGNIYVIGSTRSTEFPTNAGAFDTTYNKKTDAFVVRLSPTGSSLDYATFLGGNGGDRGYGIAVDDSGHAYVTGFTYATDFPTTAGAYDTSHNSPGGLYQDIFVAKLDRTGSALDYATFLGGDRGEGGYGIAVDQSGNAYVIGDTESTNFPATAGAFDTTHNGGKDIFVVKFDPTGSILDYATFLGGSSVEYGEGIALDGLGHACVTGETQSDDFPTTAEVFDETYNDGHDVFVAKLNATGGALDYATFLGGSSWDRGIGIAMDDSGSAYVTGYTSSTGFPHTAEAFDPTHNGGRDVFVTKLNPAGSALDYATFLGGSSDDRGHGIAVDNSGYAYVTGRTASSDFPTTVEAFDATHNGDDDVFVVELTATGSALVYGTFLGGESYEYGHGIALSGLEDVSVAGLSRSSDFPTTAGAFDSTHNGLEDVFVVRLNLSATPVVSETPPAVLPEACVLNQNYPNPFNPATTIKYALPQDVRVTLRVYNIQGAEVATLVEARQGAGVYTVRWDAQGLASGVYFCTIKAGDFQDTKKMVLLK